MGGWLVGWLRRRVVEPEPDDGRNDAENDETPRPEAGGAGKREYVALALHKEKPQADGAHSNYDPTPSALAEQSLARRFEMEAGKPAAVLSA